MLEHVALILGTANGDPMDKIRNPFSPEAGSRPPELAGRDIRFGIVRETTDMVTKRLDENFFRVRFDRLTPREKHNLHVMAEFGPGPYRTGEIADAMRMQITTLEPVRASLIKKGMVYSPSHGEMVFTVPLFDEFMRRAMPDGE